MNEFVLAEQTHAAIRSGGWEVAVLPFGATEPHNLHMPYGTDNFQVEALGRRACAHAWEKGRGCYSCRRCRSASTRTT